MSDTTPSQRCLGGLWCGDVLDRLPDYLDGQLSPDELAAVEAHLAGCDWCARFGGVYASAVSALREKLGAADPVGEDVARRLDAALLDALGDEDTYT